MVCWGVSGAVGGFIAPVPLTPRTRTLEPSNYVVPCESHVTYGQIFRQLMQNLDISIVYIDSVSSKQVFYLAMKIISKILLPSLHASLQNVSHINLPRLFWWKL